MFGGRSLSSPLLVYPDTFLEVYVGCHLVWSLWIVVHLDFNPQFIMYKADTLCLDFNGYFFFSVDIDCGVY